jgi:hypothetical protein
MAGPAHWQTTDSMSRFSLIFLTLKTNGIFPFPQFYILWIVWPLGICAFIPSNPHSLASLERRIYKMDR